MADRVRFAARSGVAASCTRIKGADHPTPKRALSHGVVDADKSSQLALSALMATTFHSKASVGVM